MSEHEAIAQVIRATGFTAMAEEYLKRPELRAHIVQAMIRNIARDSRPGLGPDAAKRFARLARLGNKWL